MMGTTDMQVGEVGRCWLKVCKWQFGKMTKSAGLMYSMMTRVKNPLRMLELC